MTKAKLDRQLRLHPRHPKNQIRDSDLLSDIERVRRIFTGWRTYSTYWRSTATVRRLQRRDKTKKQTEQAQRISDAWDQRDLRTLWSTARAMLSHPCGPKRRRYDIPLCSLPTAAARATHLRQAGPLCGMPWDESGMGSTATGSEEPRTTGGTVGRSGRVLGRTGGARGGFSWYGSLSSTITFLVARLWVGRLEANFGGRLRTRMRDNTPKKHGVGYKAQWLESFFQSRLWQGIGRVRRTGCVPMWWHRSITFPIDKSNNKEGCNAMRLVNASSPDSKAFHSYLWRRQPQTQQRAYASGCTAHRSRLESIAQSVNVAERMAQS